MGGAASMRAVLINLDRSVERLAMFRARADALGLAFERVGAVDGANETLVRGTLTPSEAACFESHRRAWMRLAESGEPWMAVFEDDVHLRAPVVELLGSGDWIPAGTNIVKLETFNEPVLVSAAGTLVHGVRLHRLRSTHLGCAGYIIARRHAIDLLERTASGAAYVLPIDWALFDLGGRARRKARVLQVVPAPCIQEERLAFLEGRPVQHESLINGRGQPLFSRVTLSGPERLRREVERLGRQLYHLPDTIREALTPAQMMTIPFGGT